MVGARTRRAKRIAAVMPIVAQLTAHSSEADNIWWARRSDYRGSEPVWLTTPFSRNGRGDEPLAESNYRVIQADIERVSAFGTDYRVDLWPGGSIHTLQVRADDALALRAVDRWVAALSDYPVADDMDFSEEEWTQNHPTRLERAADGTFTTVVSECYADRDADDPCPCGVTDEADEEIA